MVGKDTITFCPKFRNGTSHLEVSADVHGLSG